MKHTEIHEKIHKAFEQARNLHGSTRPEKSLAEKTWKLVEKLKKDTRIVLNPSPHGEAHTVHIREKLSAPNTHLDIRCAGLYEKAVRALRKEKQAGRPAPSDRNDSVTP
jgi:hypothetical protein